MNNIAVVLGTGIKEDGLLPASSVACVQKAVELQKENKVFEILFSGKWAWNLNYRPPVTEAEAMEELAKEYGATVTAKGEEGQTTVRNLCWVKMRYLKPHNYLDPVFIIPSSILQDRFEYNVQMVLGPEYKYQIVSADFQYPVEKINQLQESEKQKLQDCIKFYEGIIPGEDQKIYELSLKDLKENYQK